MLLCEIKPHFWAVSAFLARFLPHLLLLSLTVASSRESVTGFFFSPQALIRKLLRNSDDGWRQLEVVLALVVVVVVLFQTKVGSVARGKTPVFGSKNSEVNLKLNEFVFSSSQSS